MKTDIITTIRRELQQQADTKIKDSFQSFFKEKVIYYGVKTPIVSRIARQYFKQIKPLGKKEIFALCEELFKSGYTEEAFIFKSGYTEEAFIACEWANFVNDEYGPDDFAVFESWISNYVTNWATCDTLCNHAVGSFIERYPQLMENLKKWTRSENRWFRRAAAVTLILPARRGKFLKDIFEIADILLFDKDDLVQKGYGWMLKEASKVHQQEVFDYVLRNNKVMPRTALRYAIEKMPEDLRRLAMGKN